MVTLNKLTGTERAHWELHLNAVMEDTPVLGKEVLFLLEGGELPNLKHPADIHDWLEQPERRLEIEALNG